MKRSHSATPDLLASSIRRWEYLIYSNISQLCKGLAVLSLPIFGGCLNLVMCHWDVPTNQTQILGQLGHKSERKKLKSPTWWYPCEIALNKIKINQDQAPSVMAHHFTCPQAFQALGDNLFFSTGGGEPPQTWGFIPVGDLLLPKSKHQGVLHLSNSPAGQDCFKSKKEWQEKKQTTPQIQQNSWHATYFHPTATYVHTPAFSLFWGTEGWAWRPTAKLWEYTCSTILGCRVEGLLALQTLVSVTLHSCVRKKKEASLLIWSEGISLFSSKREIRFHWKR